MEVVNSNQLTAEKVVIIKNTPLERKPKHHYRQTIKSIKSIVEEAGRLYNQFDSQEQLIRKRISRDQEWTKFWIRSGNLTSKEKSMMYYADSLIQRLTNISYMKDLEHKERLLYYLKVEVSLEALQTKKPLRRSLRNFSQKEDK